MFLFLFAAFFGVFALNIVLGAYGGASFLNDVHEMLVLFAAVICFAIAVLKREAARRAENQREGRHEG